MASVFRDQRGEYRYLNMSQVIDRIGARAAEIGFPRPMVTMQDLIREGKIPRPAQSKPVTFTMPQPQEVTLTPQQITALNQPRPEDRPAPILQQPAQIDWSNAEWHPGMVGGVWLPRMASWTGSPTPRVATAVDLAELQLTVDRVPVAPTSVGQFAQWDASFDRLVTGGQLVEYQQVADLPILAPKVYQFRL